MKEKSEEVYYAKRQIETQKTERTEPGSSSSEKYERYRYLYESAIYNRFRIRRSGLRRRPFRVVGHKIAYCRRRKSQ